MSSESSSSLEALIQRLKQERDELRLQMHLASMDAQDEYQRISGKVDELTSQVEPVREAVEETGKNLYAALGLLADELQVGFQRVRKSLTE